MVQTTETSVVMTVEEGVLLKEVAEGEHPTRDLLHQTQKVGYCLTVFSSSLTANGYYRW
jgi:hypothetical protein